MSPACYRIALIVVCFVSTALHTAHGQDSTKSAVQDVSEGTLSGMVQDNFEHARITGAHIIVHPRDTLDITVAVNGLGRYSVELPPGFYDVFVSAAGFDPACQKVRIEAGKTALYDPALKASNLENSAD